MAGQFLTAVFEMRPTRRKAAALERVRAKAEHVYWNHLAAVRTEAEAIVDIAEGLPPSDLPTPPTMSGATAIAFLNWGAGHRGV